MTAVVFLVAITVLRKIPPERVYMPTLAFPWLMLLSALAPNWLAGEVHRYTLTGILQSLRTAWLLPNWRWWKPDGYRHLFLRSSSLCVLFVVFGLCLNITKHFQLGQKNARNNHEYQKMLADLRPTANQAERLVISFAADFPYEFQPALFGENDYNGLYFYALSWPQRTPYAELMKQHFQIESLGNALAEKHEIILLLHPSSYGRVLEYLEEHYSSALRIVNLKSYSRFSLSKIEPDANTAESDSTESPMLLAKPKLESGESRK